MEATKQNISRLVLGTAQLGMNYGIANTTGQPVYNTAISIIQEAWKFGVREFDTAQAYGHSERVLGRIFKDLGIAGEAKVITKFAPHIDHSDRAALNKALETSMDNLGFESLYGLMLHREDMIDLWEKGMEKNFMDIVSTRRVKHIGVSVYSPQRAIKALSTKGISIVQLPTNVIDRRFEKAGVFELADDVGKTVYIRSIFLQGLLLMPPDSLPEHMQFAVPIFDSLALLAQDAGLNIMELCVGYVKHAFPNAKIIMGVESPVQVVENLDVWNENIYGNIVDEVRCIFNNVDEKILNPAFWPNLT